MHMCLWMEGSFPSRRDSVIFEPLPHCFPGPFHLCFSYLQLVAFNFPILNYIKLTEEIGEGELCMDVSYK